LAFKDSDLKKIYMGAFVITKRFDGAYKFVFTSRKGKPIFTSSKFVLKEDCELGIVFVKNIMFDHGVYVNFKTATGKCFFKIMTDDLVLATSRKFTTELRMQKGINEIVVYGSNAEVLDFSKDDFIFSESETLD
jgi:hypothetical protein